MFLWRGFILNNNLLSMFSIFSQSSGLLSILVFLFFNSEGVVKSRHVSVLVALFVFEFKRSTCMFGATSTVHATVHTLIYLRLRSICSFMNLNKTFIFIELKIIFHGLEFFNFLAFFDALIINV